VSTHFLNCESGFYKSQPRGVVDGALVLIVQTPSFTNLGHLAPEEGSAEDAEEADAYI